MDLRCFIAVEIPAELKAAIGGLIEALKSSGADVKWARPENIHITLKFLGNTPDTKLEGINNALARKLSHYRPFYIKITHTGYFPSGRHPRVIWIGLEESETLVRIYEAVEEGMSELGFKPEDRKFSPHLTIGRVRSQVKMKELLNKMNEMRSYLSGGLEISGVVLMKSELKPMGPEYERLAEINFPRREDV
ncbi:MAG: RNA 2',3'-cyclic phosphodiesterase [Nitrospirae bacterium]|nr:RNA 2',3'-cyclic phosphodiesterase [Nitrospirota bacterium]